MSDNNNQKNNQQGDEYGGRGCIQILLLVAFVWGALMMYPKTVDLLANFAPDDFMGYTDMAGWWAMGSALLIEGVMVVLKFKMWIYPSRNLIEWAWDGILTITPFVMSALAQVFDGMLVRDTLTQQPAQIQMLVDWGVPLLPSFVIGLMIIYGLIESAPKPLFGGIQQGGGFPRLTLPNLGMLDPRKWFKGNGKNKRSENRQHPQQAYSPPKSTGNNAPNTPPATVYTLPAFLSASGINSEHAFGAFLAETETDSMARKVLRTGQSADGYKMPPNLSNSNFDELAAQIRANGKVTNP